MDHGVVAALPPERESIGRRVVGAVLTLGWSELIQLSTRKYQPWRCPECGANCIPAEGLA